MKRLLKVKVFNRIKEEEYQLLLKAWDGKSGMPYLPMYVFTKDNGVPYRKGYVVSSKGNSHKFYHTKKDVFIHEGMRVHI